MKQSVAKKRNVLLRFALLAFCIYVVVVLFRLQIQISDKRNELAEIRQAISEQQQENLDSQRFIMQDDDDELIEQYAREKLGFARPEERVYYNIMG